MRGACGSLWLADSATSSTPQASHSSTDSIPLTVQTDNSAKHHKVR
jgi:hypothetical protein